MRIAECGLRTEKQGGIRDADCESPTPNSEPPIDSFEGRPRTPHSKGFTLIEIIIVIVIIGIISTIAAVIIMQAVKMYSDENARSDIHYQSKLAVERMARETRLIRSATAADIQTWTATDLLFCDITGKAVEFQLTGTSLNRRESPTCSPIAWGAWNALSPQIDVGNSSFAYYQQDGITAPATVTAMWLVQITATSTQGASSIKIRSRVHPRNF